MDLTRPPADDDDAKARALKYEDEDPFPSIPRALLSSVEILDYAQVTGMLYPFQVEQLKSASYEVYIGGEVIWWDGKGRKQKRTIKRGDPLILEANSIVFAQVEPNFRLPNYIAIRFNLRITHVHRGLLLGTGPLVDPGFHGKLLIPLHNLTSTPYELDTTEALIWVEFTKTTFGFEPDEGLAYKPRSAFFKGFPPDKRDTSPDRYLRKANGGNPIQSSIPVAITQSAESARKAEASAARTRNISLFAALAAIIALYQVGQQFGSMVQNSQALIATVSSDAKNMAEKVTNLSTDNKTLMDKTIELEQANDKLSARVDDLGSQLQQRNATPPTPHPKRSRRANRSR
jgi:deoxycytidine triphosphate deaminase